MKFQGDQILEAVKNPTNSTEVSNGRKYESRLRLFTEAKFEDEIKKETSFTEFTDFMKEAISSEKEIRISEFIQYPFSSISMTESLMSDLYKVFDAGNAYFNVETVKKNGGDKIQEVIQELKLFNWIEEKGKAVLKNQPNTVVLVDKDEEGKPYLLAINNNRLIDIKLKDDGVNAEYVIFTHSIIKNEQGDDELRISLYDEDSYHVILKVNGAYSIEKSVLHGSDSCPARMFLREKLNSNSDFNRKTPLVNALSKLQEWQYFDIYKFYTDHTAPFPVIEMVRGKCGNDNCVNGFYMEEVQDYAGGNNVIKNIQVKCESCASANTIGVGTKILVEPQDDKDEPSASGKFRMISNDITNLEYLQDKLDSIELFIKNKVVGIDDTSKQAVNELQVKGAFESKTNVLLGIKTNLDELYVWIIQTLAKVYMNGSPLTIQANFGTEWYLKSEDDIQARLALAIEKGFPKEEVDQLYNQLIETKYKGNPDKVQRMKIINMANPCPHDNLETKLTKLQNGIISNQDLIVSERLLTFVRRFETDNGSIIDFGSELDLRQKVAKIVEQLNKYADEQANSNPKPLDGGEGANG